MPLDTCLARNASTVAIVLSIFAVPATATNTCVQAVAAPQDRDPFLALARSSGVDALNFSSVASGGNFVGRALAESYGFDLRAKGGGKSAARCRAEMQRQDFMLLVDLRNLKFGIGADPDYPAVRYQVRLNWLNQQCAQQPEAVAALLRLVEDTSAAFDDWLAAHTAAPINRKCAKSFD